MNYMILVVAALVFCSLHGALGIICNKCTPEAQDLSNLKMCIKPIELKPQDCDNEPFPEGSGFNVTEDTKYDACAKTAITAKLGGQNIQTFVFSCAVKANSTNPSVVNCSMVEDYVCRDARERAAQSSGIQYSIASCSSQCCVGDSCIDLSTPAPTTQTTTAASTTAGVSAVQPSCVGILLILLSMGFMMKKVA